MNKKKRATKKTGKRTVVVPSGATRGAPFETTAKCPGLAVPKGPGLAAQPRGGNVETIEAPGIEDTGSEEEANYPAHGAGPDPEDKEAQVPGCPLDLHETEDETGDTEAVTGQLAGVKKTALTIETSNVNSREAFML
jgi:hypothetical protein